MSEILIYFVLFLFGGVHAAVAACLFLEARQASAWGVAFGWGGSSILGDLIRSLLWPITLPLSFALYWWEERNDE